MLSQRGKLGVILDPINCAPGSLLNCAGVDVYLVLRKGYYRGKREYTVLNNSNCIGY